MSLTGLVRLELVKVNLSPTYGRMGNLGLQQLVLIECGNAETCLFESALHFRSLKTLHIEEKLDEAKLPMHIGRLSKEFIANFIRGMDVVLVLPKLEKISGNNKYLSHCMELTTNWQKSYGCGHMASPVSRCVNGIQIKIWTKS